MDYGSLERDFPCSKCTICCSKDAVELWNKNVPIWKKTNPALAEHAEPLPQADDGSCIHLDSASGECRIYNHRPLRCRSWHEWTNMLSLVRLPTQYAEPLAVYTCNQLITKYNYDSKYLLEPIGDQKMIAALAQRFVKRLRSTFEKPRLPLGDIFEHFERMGILAPQKSPLPNGDKEK